jgi:hypothetical protein
MLHPFTVNNFSVWFFFYFYYVHPYIDSDGLNKKKYKDNNNVKNSTFTSLAIFNILNFDIS